MDYKKMLKDLEIMQERCISDMLYNVGASPRTEERIVACSKAMEYLTNKIEKEDNNEG